MAVTRVSVLGLGRMGTALATAFAAAGVELTVWNRSPARAYPFEGRARLASDPAAACAQAELIVVSLSDYGAGLEVLDAAATGAVLSERTLVQLSRGTPSDARTLAAWSRMHGLRYLDAAIVGYPNAVGGAGVALFYAGDETAFERHRPTLAALGQATHFVGEEVGAAAALECAILEYYYGATLAMLHGAALCASEDLPLARYFNVVGTLGPLLCDTADGARAMIDRENYSGVDCPLNVHLAALRHVQRLSHDNDVEPRLPDTLMHTLKKAIAAGHGDDELAAAFEVLRRQRA